MSASFIVLSDDNREIEVKRCTRCHKVKRIEEFPIHNKNDLSRWRETRCRPCMNEHFRECYHRSGGREKNYNKIISDQWRRQGMKYKGQVFTREVFDKLLEYQDHKCAICQVSDWFNSLEVDHYHATGEVRGLLCGGCNRRAVARYETTGHYRSSKHEQLIRDYILDPPINHISFDHQVDWNGIREKPRRNAETHEVVIEDRIANFEVDE